MEENKKDNEVASFIRHNIGKLAHLTTKTNHNLHFVTLTEKHIPMGNSGWLIRVALLDGNGFENGNTVNAKQ